MVAGRRVVARTRRRASKICSRARVRWLMASPEETNEHVERQRGHILARRLGAPVSRSAGWCEFARVPASASGRARKCRHAPYRIRRCDENGGGWLGGSCSSDDDDETASAVPRRSWGSRVGGLSSKQTGEASW